MKQLRLLLSALALLLSLGVSAHHEVAHDIDLNAPIEVVGEFVGVEWTSPHATLLIEQKRENGQNQLWSIEVDAPAALQSNGLTRIATDRLEWVVVIMYLSQESECAAECFGYGLTLTDFKGNSYTLSRQIHSELTQLLSQSR